MTEPRKKAGIYTKKGDTGSTSLGDRSLVSKTHPRIQAVGSIDELNAGIGLAVKYCAWSNDTTLYKSIQYDLFIVGAIVGGSDQDIQMDQERIAYLEEMIDEVSSKLEPLKNFILPGGGVESSWLHFLRTVCRRAERDIVAVQEMDGNVDPNVLVYFNRLSDLFFVMARKNNDLGKSDVLWTKKVPMKGN